MFSIREVVVVLQFDTWSASQISFFVFSLSGGKSYGPRIAPDRVSSGPTRFPGSMGMIFIFEFATIDPIEEKCEHFEVSSEIFLRFAKIFGAS